MKYNADFVSERINITGKAKQWQLNSKEIVHLGSFLDNFTFNTKNELLTKSREHDDTMYLNKLKKDFQYER